MLHVHILDGGYAPEPSTLYPGELYTPSVLIVSPQLHGDPYTAMINKMDYAAKGSNRTR